MVRKRILENERRINLQNVLIFQTKRFGFQKFNFEKVNIRIVKYFYTYIDVQFLKRMIRLIYSTNPFYDHVSFKLQSVIHFS